VPDTLAEGNGLACKSQGACPFTCLACTLCLVNLPIYLTHARAQLNPGRCLEQELENKDMSKECKAEVEEVMATQAQVVTAGSLKAQVMHAFSERNPFEQCPGLTVPFTLRGRRISGWIRALMQRVAMTSKACAPTSAMLLQAKCVAAQF